MNKNSILNLRNLISNTKSFVKLFLPEKVQKKVQSILSKANNDKRKRIYFNNNLVVVNEDFSVSGAIPILYWDGEPNFGDVIGPYLVSKVTDMPVVNTLHEINTPCLMSVGSILNLIDRKNVTVWGSGLIEEPSSYELSIIKSYNPRVISVRGHKTAELLESADINIIHKDAYGDPALIMPLFYQPIPTKTFKVSICPHYTHKLEFIEKIKKNNSINIIDVQADMLSVIDQVVSSSVCISTSLHGLIVSQAYNIPWLWLEIVDNNLRGNDFKFLDFFSTIDYSMVAHVKIRLSDLEKINFEELAKQATLPDKKYSEKSILNALKSSADSVIKERLFYLP